MLLLGASEKQFTGRDGKEVSYTEASVADEDGNVFRISAAQKEDELKQAANKQGRATLDLSVRDGKLKLRLVSFEAA